MADNRACHIHSFNFEEVASIFTRVRGKRILGTSPFGHSPKFAYTEFSEVRTGLWYLALCSSVERDDPL
jgi:hypothetical protein